MSSIHALSAFEDVLTVSVEDIEFRLQGHTSIEWSDFILNPRTLRGSDFLMRWSQGVWSEERIVQAVNATNLYYAVPYGPSGTAPDHDVREFELYFERLDAAGLGKIKRPDLLVFRKNDQSVVDMIIDELGGLTELPFISEDNMKELLKKAIVAIECENSLWRAEQMPDYNTPMRSQKRLGGKLGLKKAAVLPTIIIKEQDLQPLQDWQDYAGVPIHIWHVFYDKAYGIALDEAQKLIREGLIEPTKHVFQAPNGATSQKVIYKFYYHYAYKLGHSQEEPSLVAKSITDKNGHILPYVAFSGGMLSLDNDVFEVLDELTNR
ncbi:AccI family restriction endonuclease [Candidatus Oscillochloris fontis]|uniref:AccI family restriction endonuclease n=1 Tax=Candidatus Oscillochloris fontis TaxID=2496868 RepID=UPI00101CD85B|nr:AccI family restriction endonuclease [Candidatus Oscillochloris fontis]